jgi:N-acetylmuramoyl-L-alanine amidase
MLRRRTLLRRVMTAACSVLMLPAAAHARRKRPHARAAHHHHRAVHPAQALPLVVIDPGHGGKDPGCIGIGGTEEKTIVLALGRELRRELHASPSCRVAMTRDTDVFVPLEGRVAFARRHHAALLISLHANASKNHHAHGACVYRFSYRASDAEARAMAHWENSADRYASAAFRHASKALSHILASLMRRETWRHAAWLQDSTVKALRHHVALTPIPARHARFVVLSAPDIPGVLIETGFLTNRKGEKLLSSSAHRLHLARAIRHGVEQYFARVERRGHGVG